MTSRRRLLASVVAALSVWAASFAAPALAAGSTASPRVKYAIALDANGNDHLDGLRLVYEQPVRHAPDADGSYPFTVDGYTVTGVGTAHGRHLDLTVAERSGAPDVDARPAVTYAPTTAQPVESAAGLQAAPQTVTTVVSLDSDGDGFTVADGDCNDADPAVHPGAADAPDLGQLDANCDGVDGTVADSVFVSPDGNDENAGTMAAPKLTIDAAIATAASYVPMRSVLVAAGRYDEGAGLLLHSDVGVYGGYVGDGWELRAGSNATVVTGSPQAALADGATDVTLQLLTLRGRADDTEGADPSVYGLRAVNGSRVRLENVTVAAGDASAGAPGSPGQNGVSAPANGARGAGANGTVSNGASQGCGAGPAGGLGMTSPGYPGGAGGAGGTCTGADGASGGAGGGPSGILAPGGSGGAAGSFGPGLAGGNGAGSAGFTGVSGEAGAAGLGGTDGFDSAGPAWRGVSGGTGGNGGPGGGGGGGGGGSFAVYLWNSSVAISNSSLTTGNGGAGGGGGAGGPGGEGGAGALGGSGVLFGFGAGGPGGSGGAGGSGGGGGGGAGGPSAGVFRGGTSTATIDAGTLILFGIGGAGGTSSSGAQWDGATGRAAASLP